MEVKFYKKEKAPTFNQYVQSQGSYIYANELYRSSNTPGIVLCLFSYKHATKATGTFSTEAGYMDLTFSVAIPNSFEDFLQSKGVLKSGGVSMSSLPKMSGDKKYQWVKVISKEPGKWWNSGKEQKLLLAMKLTDFNAIKNKKVVIVQNIANAPKPPPKKEQAKKTETKTQQDLTKAKKETLKKDKSEKIEDIINVTYTLDNISLYVDTAIRVLGIINEKVKKYDIKMATLPNKPIDLDYQIKKIKKFKETIVGKVKEINTDTNKDKQVNFKFNNTFELMDFTYDGVRHPDSPIAPLAPFNLGAADSMDPTVEKTKLQRLAMTPSALEVEKMNRNSSLRKTMMFSDPTGNSVIASLKKIYVEFDTKLKFKTSVLFSSKEQIQIFLNKHLYPRSTIVNFPATEKIIEKYLLGDIRYLDDDFYRKYTPYGASREQLVSSFKTEIRGQVAEQYEKLGDALGEKFITGEFEDFRNIDDLYNSLLNHISIPDLIQLSAKCLLKLIKLEDLIDYLCDGVLKKYDEYSTGIINWAEDQESPYVRWFATQLAEITLGSFEALREYSEKVVNSGIKMLGESIKEVQTLSPWKSKSATRFFMAKIKTQLDLKVTQLYGKMDEKTGKAPEIITDRNSIIWRIRDVQKQIDLLTEAANDNSQKKLILGESLKVLNLPDVDFTGDFSKRIKNLEIKKANLQEAKKNVTRQIAIYDLLYRTIIPSIVSLNPFYTAKTSDNWGFKVEGFADAIKTLEGIDYGAYAIKDAGAALQVDIAAYTPESKKTDLGENIFINQILKPLKLSLETIDKINGESPGGFLSAVGAELEKTKAVQLQQDTLKKYYSNQKEKLILCAAIFATVPAAIYAIYYLITNSSEIGDAIKQDWQKLTDAFDKRVQIFLKDDYPVEDILSAYKEELYQLGINLGRDLILNTVFFLISQLQELCADAELVNAPASPIGQIDLSSFIIKSGQKNQNAPANLENTTTFRESTLSLEDYRRLLDIISDSFTISEMCAFLDDTASFSLYNKLLLLLESLGFIRGTDFYNIFVNENGVRKLMKLLSKEINSEFCIQAKINFEKQKEAILKICGNNNESIKNSELAALLGPEDLAKALKSVKAHRKNLVGGIINSLAPILDGPISATQFCQNDKAKDSGFDPYHESQKYTNEIVSDKIFGSLEKTFEAEAARVKSIYKGTIKALADATKPNGAFDKNNKDLKNGIKGALDIEGGETNIDKLKSLSAIRNKTKTGYAGSEIVSALNDLINNTDMKTNPYFKVDPPGADIPTKKVLFELKPEGLNRRISMVYDPESEFNTLKLRLLSTEESDETSNILASYSVDKPKVAENFFVNYKKWNNLSVAYDQKMENFLLQNDLWGLSINSIFEETLLFTSRSGLYLNALNPDSPYRIFDKLNLNKKFPLANSNEQCFPGFFNKKVLAGQVRRLTKALYCFSATSVTRSSTNIAYIKVALDCLIRAIIFKEMAKTLFVFGFASIDDLYVSAWNPKDGPKEGEEEPFFSVYLRSEIELALSRQFSNFSKGTVDNFYVEVVQEFITDLMRILYQDSTITTDEAINLIISEQFQYVKETFRLSLPQEIKTLPGYFNPELIQQVKILDGTYTYDDKFINLPSSISFKDQIHLIQGDYLTKYTKTFYNAELTKANWINFIEIVQPANPNQPPEEVEAGIKSIHLSRKHSTPLKKFLSFPLDNPQNPEDLPESNNLEELLDGVDSGFASEKMVEIKYKKTFFDNLSEEQKDKLKKLFYMFQYSMNNESNLLLLKGFLYSTKLIMFFPQIHGAFQDANKGKSFGIKATPKLLGGWDNIFWDLFRYNFIPDSLSDDLKKKLLTDERLDWSLNGKIYLNDFKNITKEFLYPDVNLGLGTKEDFLFKYTLGFNLGTLNSNNKPAVQGNIPTPLDPNDIDKGVIMPGNSYAQQWYKFTLKEIEALQWTGGRKALMSPIVSWQSLNNADEQYDATAYSAAKLKTNNLFSWLLLQRVDNIMDIHLIARISQYVSEKDRPGIQDAFDSSMGLNSQNLSVKERIDTVKYLTEEKTVNVNFEDDGGTHNYTTFPVFSVASIIPEDRNWFDLFYKTYKRETSTGPPISQIPKWVGDQAVFGKELSDLLKKIANWKNKGIPGTADGSPPPFKPFIPIPLGKTELLKNVNFLGEPEYYFFNPNTLEVTQAIPSLANLITPGGEYNEISMQDMNYDTWEPIRDFIRKELEVKVYKKLPDGQWPGWPTLGQPNAVQSPFLAGAWFKELWGEYLNDSIFGNQAAKEIYAAILSLGSDFSEKPEKYFKNEVLYKKLIESNWGKGIANFNHSAPVYNPHYMAQGYVNRKYYAHPYSTNLGTWEYYGPIGLFSADIDMEAKKTLSKFIWIIQNIIYNIQTEQSLRYVENALLSYPIPDEYPEDKAYQAAMLSDLAASQLYPYDQSSTPAGDWGDLKGTDAVFYHPGDAKKDIYTIVEKFSDENSLSPELAVSMFIADAPAMLNPVFPFGMITASDQFKQFVRSFFLKEQATIITILHRLYSEKFYPTLEDNFNGTIYEAADTLMSAIAVANGDYRRNSAVNDPNKDFPINPGGIDLKSFGWEMVKALLASYANVTDPTWKTDWFTPGPLTPAGFVTKALIENPWDWDASNLGGNDDEDKTKKVGMCDDVLQKQVDLIDYGPFLDKPEKE